MLYQLIDEPHPLILDLYFAKQKLHYINLRHYGSLAQQPIVGQILHKVYGHPICLGMQCTQHEDPGHQQIIMCCCFVHLDLAL